MRTLTQIVKEAKEKLNIQDETVNYISSSDLKKYLEVANNFLSNESKYIINYLIEHNAEYVNELGKGKSGNALANFYDNGVPKDADKKELYKSVGILYKKNRLLEIPVFQTKEQFEAIINKKESPDQILLDLDSEAGRNAIAKQYKPLMHKICRQYLGKSNLSYEDLLSSAATGLTYAMNYYGKRNKSTVSDEKISAVTFGQYAAQWIRIYILEDIKNVSRTVRIPVSQQQKERDETGSNTRNNTISGDTVIGGSDSEGNKTVFDYVGGSEEAGKSVDKEDVKKLWKAIYKKLEEKFDKDTLDIWMSFYGLNDHEKMQNKEIAKKYGIGTSNVTYYLTKVNNFIRKDPKMFAMFTDVYELMKECKNDEDREDINEESRTININDED